MQSRLPNTMPRSCTPDSNFQSLCTGLQLEKYAILPRAGECNQLCEVKIFQLQSMLNVIRCIGQRFAFKNSGILCDFVSVALIFKLKNPSMTVLYAKKSVAGGEL